MKNFFYYCLVPCLFFLGCRSVQTDGSVAEFSGWLLRPEPNGRVIHKDNDRRVITCSGDFLVKKPGGRLNSLLYFGAFEQTGAYKLCFESSEKASVKASFLIARIDIIDDGSPQPIFTPTLVRVLLNQGRGMDSSVVHQKARDIANGSLTHIKSKSDFAGYLIALMQDSTGSIPELPVDDTRDTEDLRKDAWYHRDVILARFISKSHPQVIIE